MILVEEGHFCHKFFVFRHSTVDGNSWTSTVTLKMLDAVFDSSCHRRRLSATVDGHPRFQIFWPFCYILVFFSSCLIYMDYGIFCTNPPQSFSFLCWQKGGEISMSLIALGSLKSFDAKALSISKSSTSHIEGELFSMHGLRGSNMSNNFSNSKLLLLKRLWTFTLIV